MSGSASDPSAGARRPDTAAASPTQTSSGNDARPSVDAHTLLQLAEAADGQRERMLALVWNPAANRYELEPEGNSKNEVLLKVRTSYRLRGRRRIIDMVAVKHVDGEFYPLAGDIDAMFWSEAAVEKFVIPYYARVLGVEGVDKLWQAFLKPDIVAVIHTEPTHYGFLTGEEAVHLLRAREGLVSPFEIISLAQWIAEQQ